MKFHGFMVNKFDSKALKLLLIHSVLWQVVPTEVKLTMRSLASYRSILKV